MQSMQNQHIMLGAAEVHVYVQNWQLHTVSAYVLRAFFGGAPPANKKRENLKICYDRETASEGDH